MGANTMLVSVPSVAFQGISTVGVSVEVNISSRGLPYFDIVGLPAKSIDESKHRIKAAFQNSGLKFPEKKITVNLAPADIHKEGSFYDLPIALGIYCADRGIKLPESSLFFGEVSLDGSLRHSKGSFLLSIYAKEEKIKKVFVPESCANETGAMSGIQVYGVKNITELFSCLDGQEEIKPYKHKRPKIENDSYNTELIDSVIGQDYVKRALQIAAAGGHNILLVGSPGSGKTLLARAFSQLLPPLSEEESIEVTKIYSSVGLIPPNGSLIIDRPFRSPHHTISYAGMIGGGSKPSPGEITLAHRGVLFMDELSEFNRAVLEALRQPMEDGVVTISRSNGSLEFPAKFMLIASTNPCPCGYYGHESIKCTCTSGQIRHYQKKLSGPIMDRIDLSVLVNPVETQDLSVRNLKLPHTQKNIEFAESIHLSRNVQNKRFRHEQIYSNSEMSNKHIKKYVDMEQEAEVFLNDVSKKFNLSARGFFRLVKVSKTISDLANSSFIKMEHIAEAIQYRFRF